MIQLNMGRYFMSMCKCFQEPNVSTYTSMRVNIPIYEMRESLHVLHYNNIIIDIINTPFNRRSSI